MYFIKTSVNDLRSLMDKKDTIDATMLGSPGDNSSDIANYKLYLNKSIDFDLLSSLISQENYQGQTYENTCVLQFKYGFIKYVASKGYKLAKRYKRVSIQGKLVVFRIENYIAINSFETKFLKGQK